MKSNPVLKSVQERVFNGFKQAEQNQLVFHNYSHTIEVVQAAEEIGKASGLSKKELEVLLIAAWFHDIGYLNSYENHEEISANYVSDFLEELNYDQEKINIICSAIIATKYPQKPQNLIEEVLCDADLAHLSKKAYLEKSQLLEIELEFIKGSPRDKTWAEMEFDFLTKHKYHTEYASRNYANGKAKNILLIDQVKLKSVKQKERQQKDLLKSKTPERGIETMFRIAFRNHMSFSSIADNKANIMLSINAIIISISLSTLIPSFDDSPALIIPTLILLIVCVLTIIFATMSTRPKISKGEFTREDVHQKKPNLLFFGNFYGMPLEEFEWGMEKMMNNREFLYGSLIKDFYSLGTVLARKYKYLRICYHIFMYGMIITVFAFVASYLFTRY